VTSNHILTKYTRDVAQDSVKSWTAGTLLIFDFTAVSLCWQLCFLTSRPS